MADFSPVGDIVDTDYDGSTYRIAVSACSECGAVVTALYEELHAESHKTDQGPVIEFDWEDDDYATILYNGTRVGHYSHDAHGRDGLAGLLELAQGIANALHGTFRSEN